MTFRADEFVAARDAARSFSSLVERLVTGEQEKVVVLHRNRPSVVMISWDEYARLTGESAPQTPADGVS